MPAGLRLPAQSPLLLALLLVPLISLALAWQTRQLMLEVRETPRTSPLNSPQPAAQYDLNSLLPLFGDAPQTASAPPATNLRLSLLGSFVNPEARRSSAIIRLDDGKPKRFAVGDTVQDGIALHAVYPDRVELERQGRLETLSFPGTRQTTGLAPQAPAMPDAPSASAEQLEMLQDEEFVQLRERMARLRQEMGDAGLTPEASEPTPAETP